MSTSLKARLYQAASQDQGLLPLLQDYNTPFRWWDTRLQQKSAFPAIVVTQVSNPRTYTALGALPTSSNRIQFTIYAPAADSESANDVVNALQAFLSTFSAGSGLDVPAYQNLIVGDRDMGIADTQPLTFQRILDVKIFSNDSL